MYKDLTKNNQGFTLIELLTVIGIVGILAAVGAPSYQIMKKNVELNNYAKEIVSNLRLAQNNAISSQDNEKWGIRFEQAQYILCKADCSPANYISIFHLDNGVQITQGVDTSIIFNRLSGTKTTAETQTIVVGDKKDIQVDSIGKITMQ